MKCNGMLCHALGGAVIFISLQHFISPSLNIVLCLSVCLSCFLLPACPHHVGRRQQEQYKFLLESDIILLVEKYSVLGNFSGHNSFSKIVAFSVYEGRIGLEVDIVIWLCLNWLNSIDTYDILNLVICVRKGLYKHEKL